MFETHWILFEFCIDCCGYGILISIDCPFLCTCNQIPFYILRSPLEFIFVWWCVTENTLNEFVFNAKTGDIFTLLWKGVKFFKWSCNQVIETLIQMFHMYNCIYILFFHLPTMSREVRNISSNIGIAFIHFNWWPFVCQMFFFFFSFFCHLTKKLKM